MDSGFRAHVGLASAQKFFLKAQTRDLNAALGDIKEALLTPDIPLGVHEFLSRVQDNLQAGLTLGEHITQLSNDDCVIAGDQLAHWTMLQRDRWLSQLPESVSKETLLKLRTCPISGPDLFDQELLISTAREIKENRSEEVGRQLELSVVPHVNKRGAAGKGRNFEGPPSKVPKVNRPNAKQRKANANRLASGNGAPAANSNAVPGLLQLSKQLQQVNANFRLNSNNAANSQQSSASRGRGGPKRGRGGQRGGSNPNWKR